MHVQGCPKAKADATLGVFIFRQITFFANFNTPLSSEESHRRGW